MIHLICASNRHLYPDALDEMHRARHEYFVKGRGWTNLASENECEVDAYDDDRTIYLIGFEPDGTIGASLRLLPADKGCLLADHFPHLVRDGEARGSGVFELSRYFASPPRRGPAGFAMRSALHIAALEAVGARGAQRLVSFTDTTVMTLLRYTGWRVKPIGLPCAYDEGTAAAFEIACAPADLDAARTALSLQGRQLFEAPSWLPAGADVHALADAMGLILNAPETVQAPLVERIRQATADWSPQGEVDTVIARLGRVAA